MKITTSLSRFLVLTWASQSINAQLFGYDERSWYGSFGLSKACVDVYNTHVSCDKALKSATNFDWAPDGELLDSVSLARVCVPKCRDELQSVRNKVISTSNGQTLVRYEEFIYPAVFIIDHYLYQYDASCRVDKNTGQLCDICIGNMKNQSEEVDECSDCVLADYAAQLNSPLVSEFYYDEQVEAFASIKSMCGTVAASYTITKSAYPTYSTIPTTTIPTTTAETTTTTPTTTGVTTPTVSTKQAESQTLPPTCDEKDTGVQKGTCSSTSPAQRASTHSIIALNALIIFWAIAVCTHTF